MIDLDALEKLCEQAERARTECPISGQGGTRLKVCPKCSAQTADPCWPAVLADGELSDAARTGISELIERVRELEASLDEIINYDGGADSALDDEYVMDRARAALEPKEGEG